MATDSEHQPIPPAAPRRLRTIALVGIDGSGKTTQAHRLAAELTAQGLRATYRRNAGGRRWFGRLATSLGRRDAEHLLGRRSVLLIESVLRWLAIARTLLRRSVNGEIAVMDRYAVCQYASLRSHAAGSAIGRDVPGRAERLARLAYRLFPDPDVTFLLAVDPSVAYERIESRGYDHETMDYLRTAAAAYRGLPEYATFVVIDANGTPEQVSAAIRADLAARLPTTSPGRTLAVAPARPAPGASATPAARPTPAPAARPAPTPAAGPAPIPASGPAPAARPAPGARPAAGAPAGPASSSRPAVPVAAATVGSEVSIALSTGPFPAGCAGGRWPGGPVTID